MNSIGINITSCSISSFSLSFNIYCKHFATFLPNLSKHKFNEVIRVLCRKNICEPPPPPNSYIEALSHTVALFGDGVCKGVIYVKLKL